MSLFAIWGVDPSFQISKKNRSSRLIVVSPRGSNETTVQKETAGMNGFSYQGNDDFAG